MDDFLLILRSKEESKRVKCIIEKYLKDVLHLSLNKKTNYFPNKNGINFCGFKIYRNKIKLANSNKKRINKRVREWKKKYVKKKLDFNSAGVSFASWEGHARHETHQITIKSMRQKCKWIYKE